MLRDFVDLARLHRLHAYEVPSHVLLVHQPFTQANHQLTKSNKVSRLHIQHHFEEAILECINARPAAAIGHVDAKDEDPTAAVQDLLHRTLSCTSDFGDLSFRQLGGDSLSAVQFIRELPPSLRHRLSAQDLLQEQPLSRVIATVHGPPAPIELPAVVSEDFPRTVEFSALAFGLKVLISKKVNEPIHQKVLFTGATGFIGAHFLARILSDAESRPDRIYVLIRAPDRDHALQRLRRVFCGYQLDQALLGAKARLRVVAGDLSLPHFGWPGPLWERYTAKLHRVYHLGAEVNHILPYDVLKGPNVEGTRTVLRFCVTSLTKPLLYLSTLSVLPAISGVHERHTVQQPEVVENWRGLNGQHRGYLQSKFVAEYLCQLARNVGCPVVIVRPGFISWSTKTGIGCRGDWLDRLMQGLLEAGCAPEVDAHLDITPVDFAAETLHRIASLSPSARSATFHLCSPQQLTPVSKIFSGAFPELVSLEYFEPYVRELTRERPSDKNLTYLAMQDWQSIDDRQRYHRNDLFRTVVDGTLGAKPRLEFPRLGPEQIKMWMEKTKGR